MTPYFLGHLAPSVKNTIIFNKVENFLDKTWGTVVRMAILCRAVNVRKLRKTLEAILLTKNFNFLSCLKN